MPAEPHGLKLIEKVVAELVLVNKKGTDLKDFLFEHSDNLSLYLTLRHAFLSPRFKN